MINYKFENMSLPQHSPLAYAYGAQNTYIFSIPKSSQTQSCLNTKILNDFICLVWSGITLEILDYNVSL